MGEDFGWRNDGRRRKNRPRSVFPASFSSRFDANLPKKGSLVWNTSRWGSDEKKMVSENNSLWKIESCNSISTSWVSLAFPYFTIDHRWPRFTCIGWPKDSCFADRLVWNKYERTGHPGGPLLRGLVDTDRDPAILTFFRPPNFANFGLGNRPIECVVGEKMRLRTDPKIIRRVAPLFSNEKWVISVKCDGRISAEEMMGGENKQQIPPRSVITYFEFVTLRRRFLPKMSFESEIRCEVYRGKIDVLRIQVILKK